MDNPTDEGGRPPYKPTLSQREDVMNLIATGSSEAEVALAIGVHRSTLREHFASELATAKAKKRSLWTSWLVGSAKPTRDSKGNVSAQKALLALAVGMTSEEGAEDKPARSMQLGKKEVAQMQAESAAIGLYETPAPPGKGTRTVQ